MQLPTVLGGRAQPARLPSITQIYLSWWIRFATLVWVACVIALTVHMPSASTERAKPFFLPPMPPPDQGISAEPEPLARQLQPLVPFLASQEGRAGLAVIDGGSHHVVMQANSHQPFVLASVAKLYILTAYLNLVASENRELSGDEHDLLSDMIEASDNYAATTLWDRIGKTEGLQHYLASRGLPAVEASAEDDSWGDLRADAVSVGALLTGLYEGRLLPPDLTALALHLMSHVIDSQAWGLGVVTRDDQRMMEAAPQVYLKDGWYPEDGGWVVNSAGVIARGAQHYVIVVLTDGQPSFRAGVELIETAVAFVAQRLP